jgi:hypothetical protein
MIALRQIQAIDGDFVTIKLPPEFKHYQQAEIIILPFDEVLKKMIPKRLYSILPVR